MTEGDGRGARWWEVPDAETVWRVCHAIRKGGCTRCRTSESTRVGGRAAKFTRGCYLQAVECVNIVQTGNPWRKTSNVPAPWTALSPTPPQGERVAMHDRDAAEHVQSADADGHKGAAETAGRWLCDHHRAALESLLAEADYDETQALRDESAHDEANAVASAAKAWSRAQEAKARRQALQFVLDFEPALSSEAPSQPLSGSEANTDRILSAKAAPMANLPPPQGSEVERLVESLRHVAHVYGRGLPAWVGSRLYEAAQALQDAEARTERGLDREAVARIVDPVAWSERPKLLSNADWWDGEGGRPEMAASFREQAAREIEPSLAKADAIIALARSALQTKETGA